MDRIGALRPLMWLMQPTSDYLAHMDWTFLRTRDEGFFITSDHPVGTVDPVSRTFETGFGIPNVEISFALSPAAAVVMRWQAPGAMRWRDRDATSDEIAQINSRTALRARQLFAPHPVFPGSERILADRARPLEPAAAARTHRVPGEVGYLVEFRQPTPRTTDSGWLVPLLEHNPDRETFRLLRALDARWAPRSEGTNV